MSGRFEDIVPCAGRMSPDIKIFCGRTSLGPLLGDKGFARPRGVDFESGALINCRLSTSICNIFQSDRVAFCRVFQEVSVFI